MGLGTGVLPGVSVLGCGFGLCGRVVIQQTSRNA